MTKAKHNGSKLSPANGRALLDHFATQLRHLVERERTESRVKYFPPSISPEIATYVLASFDTFKAHPERGLDRAFGLTRKGRPTGSGKMQSTIKLIGDRRMAGASWTQLGAELNREPRDLQRMIHETYRQEYFDYICSKVG